MRAQPAEAPSLDTGVVATNVLPSSGGPSVLGLDDAVTTLTEAVDWERLRQLSAPGLAHTLAPAPGAAACAPGRAETEQAERGLIAAQDVGVGAGCAATA